MFERLKKIYSNYLENQERINKELEEYEEEQKRKENEFYNRKKATWIKLAKTDDDAERLFAIAFYCHHNLNDEKFRQLDAEWKEYYANGKESGIPILPYYYYILERIEINIKDKVINSTMDETKIQYSMNSNLFQKELTPNSPFEMDYAFFFGDLMDALIKKGKLNIIPYSPYGNAFTATVKDATYDKDNGNMTIAFDEANDFSFHLSKTEIQQPSASKFYVNSQNHEQQLNFTFIK